MRGLATGTTVGDVLKGKYTNNNSESLRYPLAHKFKTWQQLFWLHDRYFNLKRGRNSHNRNLRPKDGFWVIFDQPKSRQAPLSSGIAGSKIRLFAIPDIERYRMQINYPAGLPRRHLFWREEMADNVVAFGHKANEQVVTNRGVNNREAWYEYKCKMMQVFAMNTFCKDLLEFSHNQGWNGQKHILGYFVSDVERVGAFSMAAEALAVANGDPTMIGYLVGNSFNRGFPEYVRNFNAAFLALPALPSRIVKNAAKHPKVIVRAIKTPNHGTYLAIVNSSWNNIKTTVKLPVTGKTINCVTGNASYSG